MSKNHDIRILVMEPPNQQLPIDTARPNGALGPAFLVGALRNAGFAVDYLDATVGPDGFPLDRSFYNRVNQENGTIRYGMSEADLEAELGKYDLIATSSIFSAQTRMHVQVAKIVRKAEKAKGKRIYLFSGGVNARAMRSVFLNEGFDLICLAEGERVIVDAARLLSEGDDDFSKLSGVVIRTADGIKTIPVKEKLGAKLEQYPFPAFDMFPLDKYQEIGIPHAGVLPKGMRYGAIQTSRGCQDRCSFCHISMEKQQHELLGNVAALRMFSLERVGQEVDRAVALGMRRLYFEDDNLFFNKKRIEDLVPFLRREGLEYSNVNGANLRFLFTSDETGRKILDEKFIETLQEIGLKELVMPFESRNPEVLKNYASGKFNPVEMNPFILVKRLKKAGIRLSGNFMIGFRDESWESVLSTKEYARMLVEAGLDAVGFMIPVPYPGSLDFEHYMQIPKFKAAFDSDPLYYTDRMHWRAKPVFETLIPGEKLAESVRTFWEEINPKSYRERKLSENVVSASATG